MGQIKNIKLHIVTDIKRKFSNLNTSLKTNKQDLVLTNKQTNKQSNNKNKMVVDTKLYDILGVGPDAQINDIKKQYKKLARQFHPDKAGSDTEEKFKEISFAHEVLTNPEKRELYDAYGEKGLREGGMGHGMDDIFSHIFGGGGHGGGLFSGFGPFGMGGMHGMGGGRRRQQRRGEDTVHTLKVTLEDLHNGKTSKLKLTKKVICEACGGAGGKGNAVQKCYSCDGNGIKISLQPLGPGMVQQVQRVCPDCAGEGEVIDPRKKCKDCNGKKVVEEKKILEVQVDKGMKEGQKITFRGEGDQLPGVETGVVVIVLQQLPHDRFTRHGDDLSMNLQIGLTEALIGFKIPIQHLDNRELLVTSQGRVVEPGCKKVVLHEGMPMHRNPFEKGHLYIEFEVIFPPNDFLPEDALKALEKVLPKREIPMEADLTAEDVEEAELVNFSDTSYKKERGRHHDQQEMDDDEPGMHGHAHGGPGVQCAQQ